jgi:hypothetical protein
MATGGKGLIKIKVRFKAGDRAPDAPLQEGKGGHARRTDRLPAP